MTKLNECDLRRLIMQNTDYTPTTKLTLLALLLKVDWSTWQGIATVPELALLAGISKRSVQTALSTLEQSNAIVRKWVNHQARQLPHVTLNIHKLTGVQILQGGANSAGVQILHSRGANLAQGGANSAQRGANSAPLQYIQSNIQSNIQLTEVSTELEQKTEVEPSTENDLEFRINKPIISKPQALTAQMIQTIEQHAQFAGHDERVRVAKEHLNIKLLKGGYYEQL